VVLDSLHLDRMALTPAPGGEATAECPFCGAKSGHFYVNLTKGVYYCHKCGVSGRLSGPPRIPEMPVAPTVETASPDRLDRVYRALLSVLALSEEHTRHLLEVRGMSPEQVKANGYRTLPHGRRMEIARKVADMCDPSGVPGFYRLYGEWNLAGYPGLLIAVRDWSGRIVGCQIRTFESTESDLPKYLWLSSAGKEGGSRASTRTHVVYGSKDMRTIWLTEGPLKADVSAPRIGKIVVAIPGVNTLRPSLAEEMKRRGCRKVVLAFDSDAYSNPNVARALHKAVDVLSGAGLEVQVATWPQDHKGLDDLLLAGGKPSLGRVRRADKTVNQIFLSGYVKRVTVGDVSSRGEDKLRKMTIVIDDPQGHPIPALAFSKVAGSLESQNPEPGDWIEAEGRIRSWPGRYAEVSANVVITSARVLKKMKPAWWEVEPESQDAAGSTERQSRA
jgi:DNA primase